MTVCANRPPEDVGSFTSCKAACGTCICGADVIEDEASEEDA